MAVTVKKIVLWRKEVENRTGILANALAPLAVFGPSNSCLRFAPAVTGRNPRLGSSGEVAGLHAGGTSCAPSGAQITH